GAFSHNSYTGAKEEYGVRQLRLSPSVIPRLRQVMATHELELTTLIGGAWGVLLSRYCSEQKVVFGVTLSARPAGSGTAEMMLGPLTNTLPVLIKICDESITQAWLRELQIQQTRLRQYAYTSLAQIRGWIGQPKDLPLFESRLILDSYSVDVFTQYRFKTLHLSNLRCFGDARVPL